MSFEMAQDRTGRIRAALEGAGLKWLFNAPDAGERARGLAEEFVEAEEFYNHRYASTRDLLNEVEKTPELYTPFLQSIGLPLSKEVRTVILRLVEGKELRAIDFHYHKGGGSTLSFTLSDPDEVIHAMSPWDALILPQLGYLVLDDRMLLGGVRPWSMPAEGET